MVAIRPEGLASANLAFNAIAKALAAERYNHKCLSSTISVIYHNTPNACTPVVSCTREQTSAILSGTPRDSVDIIHAVRIWKAGEEGRGDGCALLVG
jgi:hypothetical protein